MSAAINAKSVLINAQYGTEKALIIRSQTQWPQWNNTLNLEDRVPEAEASTREDFRNRNFRSQEYCLETALTINASYQYVDAVTFDKMQIEIQQPMPDGGYPDPILALGRVGFNTGRTQALVYTAYTCGGLCGEGDLYLLRKSGSSWVVVKSIRLFAS